MPSDEVIANGRSRRPQRTAEASSFVVDVRTPRHSSVFSNLLKDNNNQLCFSLILVCYQQSALWQNLGPMIYLDDSQPHQRGVLNCRSSSRSRCNSDKNRISSRLLDVLFQNSLQSTTTTTSDQSPTSSASFSSSLLAIKRVVKEAATAFRKLTEDQDDTNDVEQDDDNSAATADFHQRKVNVPLDCLQPVLEKLNYTQQQPLQIRVYILPSLITNHVEMTFNRLVLSHERTMLTKQTLSAWMATLGGGYFFIRRLSFSLVLARQQRVLALQIGNRSMARTCLLNEAYNLIYAGKFKQGKITLTRLEEEVHVGRKKGLIEDEDATVTLNQCLAARLLLSRLKKMSNKLQRYHTNNHPNEDHTKDDFQRLRIVVQES
jgi:hypothetical protein